MIQFVHPTVYLAPLLRVDVICPAAFDVHEVEETRAVRVLIEHPHWKERRSVFVADRRTCSRAGRTCRTRARSCPAGGSLFVHGRLSGRRGLTGPARVGRSAPPAIYPIIQAGGQVSGGSRPRTPSLTSRGVAHRGRLNVRVRPDGCAPPRRTPLPNRRLLGPSHR